MLPYCLNILFKSQFKDSCHRPLALSDHSPVVCFPQPWVTHTQFTYYKFVGACPKVTGALELQGDLTANQCARGIIYS